MPFFVACVLDAQLLLVRACYHIQLLMMLSVFSICFMWVLFHVNVRYLAKYPIYDTCIESYRAYVSVVMYMMN